MIKAAANDTDAFGFSFLRPETLRSFQDASEVPALWAHNRESWSANRIDHALPSRASEFSHVATVLDTHEPTPHESRLQAMLREGIKGTACDPESNDWEDSDGWRYEMCGAIKRTFS